VKVKRLPRAEVGSGVPPAFLIVTFPKAS